MRTAGRGADAAAACGAFGAAPLQAAERPTASGPPLRLRRYAQDNTVFLDDQYLIRRRRRRDPVEARRGIRRERSLRIFESRIAARARSAAAGHSGQPRSAPRPAAAAPRRASRGDPDRKDWPRTLSLQRREAARDGERGALAASHWLLARDAFASPSPALRAASLPKERQRQEPRPALRAISDVHGCANAAGACAAQGSANAAEAWMRWSGDALERLPNERRRKESLLLWERVGVRAPERAVPGAFGRLAFGATGR